MQKISKNEHGFSAVETVVVIVVIVLIGAVGAMTYWRAHHTNAQSATATSRGVTSATSESGKVLQLKELGVQFVAPPELKNLIYTVEKGSDGQGGMVTIATLRDPQLTNLVNECISGLGIPPITDAPDFAAVSRTEGQYDAVKEMSESQLLKQFGTFHIMVTYPNGLNCGSSNQKLLNAFFAAYHKDQTEFANAFKATAQEIKN